MNKKIFDIFIIYNYNIVNKPATPLSSRVNAHFGQVFFYIKPISLRGNHGRL